MQHDHVYRDSSFGPVGADNRAAAKGAIVPSVPLPENPSFEQLKKQAKELQRQVRANDGGTLALVSELHPRGGPSASEVTRFKRSDAQLVVARFYGFASWRQLKAHLRAVETFTRPDTADVESASVGDEFASLACASYGYADPMERIDLAKVMLDQDPTVASSSIAAMSAAGDHDALAALVVADPTVTNVPTGPNQWPPLLYCAYSRISGHEPSLSAIETARLLIESGADPNAGFLWRGLVPPFTALTGAFGGGERDQPPHPAGLALARLLLEAGADPNDGQALYNNGLAGTARDDATHLELLIEYGLGSDQNGPWYQRLGQRLTAPIELLYDELEVAAHRGLVKRMQFLVGLGLDLERGVGRSGQTPAHLARQKGHADVLEVLAAAGVAT